MAFFDRTTIHGLLLAGGTALLVGVVGQLNSHALLDEADLQADQDKAQQIATALGPDLLEPSTMPAGSATHAALQRLLSYDPRIQSICTVAPRDDRHVIVLSVTREHGTRLAGAPIKLTEQGYRAFRTGRPTTEQGPRTLAYVPVFGSNQDALGLLVVETETRSTASADVWILLVLPLLVAAAAGVWLTMQFARPLARIQSVFSDRAAGLPQPRSIVEAADSIGDLVARLSHDRHVLEAQVRANARHAKETSQARDELVSNTVHELRAPLSTVIATLEVLDNFNDVTQAERAEFLAQAAAACQHMRLLVNDIMDSAAMESGTFAVQPGTCSLNEIFRAARRVMQPSALASRIELTIESSDPDIHVHADQSRVLQVLFNLMSNAIKYSGSGRIVTLRATANEVAAVIEIEDEGEGVPSAARAHLFSKFARLPRSHQRVVDSSGIGLYLSKQLVELMNGTIGHRGRDGEGKTGSVFWFTLPLAHGPIRAQEPVIAQEPVGDGEPVAPVRAPLEPTLDEGT